jgi:hypothetical protein
MLKSEIVVRAVGPWVLAYILALLPNILGWLRRGATLTKRILAIAMMVTSAVLVVYVATAEIKERRNLAQHQTKIAALRSEISKRLASGYQLQSEIYSFRPQDFKRAEKKVEQWRTEIIAFLDHALPESGAKDRFQQVSLAYQHRNRLEWVQLWLAELRILLATISAQVEVYESAQKVGSMPKS